MIISLLIYTHTQYEIFGWLHSYVHDMYNIISEYCCGILYFEKTAQMDRSLQDDAIDYLKVCYDESKFVHVEDRCA